MLRTTTGCRYNIGDLQLASNFRKNNRFCNITIRLPVALEVFLRDLLLVCDILSDITNAGVLLGMTIQFNNKFIVRGCT